jgi:hypothetical protein
MMEIVVEGGNEEVVVEQFEDVLDDGISGDFAFIVTVMIQEAVEQELFESFGL